MQPDAFFILLILGVLGLYVEFTHPGAFAPGVIGGIALVLALFAMHMLPINFAGVLLIVLAMALFILEAKFPSARNTGDWRSLSMVLGALLLIRSPLTGMGVSLWTALGVVIAVRGSSTIILMRLVLRSRTGKFRPARADDRDGRSAPKRCGRCGRGPFAGMVRMRGELWRARRGKPIPAGARVRVRK